MEERRKGSAGAVLETSVGGLQETVLPYEVFEKSDELLLGDIAAVGFREEGEIGDGAIGIEINVHPQFGAFDIKLEISGIILDVHQEFAPSFISLIQVVFIHSHEHIRMLL